MLFFFKSFPFPNKLLSDYSECESIIEKKKILWKEKETAFASLVSISLSEMSS